MKKHQNRPNTSFPTEIEFDELLVFLPELYQKGFHPVENWGELKESDSGALIMPGPKYHSLVLDFIEVTSKEIWTNHGYRPHEAWEMLKSPQQVASASYEQVKSMLTYYVRGERFSDGHWGRMIKEGHIRRLLEPLAELREEFYRS